MEGQGILCGVLFAVVLEHSPTGPGAHQYFFWFFPLRSRRFHVCQYKQNILEVEYRLLGARMCRIAISEVNNPFCSAP